MKARAKIHLYSVEVVGGGEGLGGDQVTSPAPPPTVGTLSHQLFLDINQANEDEAKINLNSYLKLIKITKQRLNNKSSSSKSSNLSGGGGGPVNPVVSSSTSGKHKRFLEFEVVDLAQTKSNIKYKVKTKKQKNLKNQTPKNEQID